MRIRKKYQVIPTNAKLENGHSTSDKNGYTCEYLNGALDYSETEQVIGRWIDNKPIYRKVVEYSNTTTIGNDSSSTVISINHNISNLDKILRAFGSSSSGQIIPRNDLQIPYYTTTIFQFQIINNTFSPRTWYFVLEYTKTTDD